MSTISVVEARSKKFDSSYTRRDGILSSQIVAAGNELDVTDTPCMGFRALSDGDLYWTGYDGEDVGPVPMLAGEWMPVTAVVLLATTTCNVLVYW